MAWRLVKQPNGLYAKFSEVVDDFTDYDMTRHDACVLCVIEHGMSFSQFDTKIESADRELSRFDECMKIIAEIHGTEKGI